MSERRVRDLAASVRARLLDLARQTRVEFQAVLNRYVSERFLWRLGQSQHASSFVLKGAALFNLTGSTPRPTRDVDLLGRGSCELHDVLEVVTSVCAQSCADGVAFRLGTAKGAAIRENERYEGVRVQIEADIAGAMVHLQVDVGFGDAVTPGPRQVTYPTLLDMPAPVVLAYPLETVIAEKFEAMVKLGIVNSRMKDFYDVYVLACSESFTGDILEDAIRNTFERRLTTLPTSVPLAFTAGFGRDADKEKQWSAFLRRNRLTAPSLMETIDVIRSLVWSVIANDTGNSTRVRVWFPERGWNEAS